METAYGLTRPTFDDARDAVHRVHGPDGPDVWRELAKSAGLTGTEPDAVDRLLPLMTAADPTTRLCAVALQIRITSYDCLAAAHLEIRSQT
ncbi:hypothetical protein [Actinoplanes derwentensis]|uniref:Uncharacterized protein n=1 Tax=Actinoplanes derwentensis TaxID=113562 RepID=A0A1H1PK67_9ACTN|nr:hypothetical protein [Actinoplanes derwentensis]GID84901.1 hypothetical protein Ade03nite_38250 [Actinoplanes derwentensis]SDS11576.1 hypothetical protein SAMN04489716_0045 [Actinoplanes derwentensis]